MDAVGAGSPGDSRRARSVAPAALLAGLALSACRTAPPVAVATPYGTVRADDEPTARCFAAALERASRRLDRLSPPRPAPAVEVWVSAVSAGVSAGVCGNARRGLLSARWTIRVDRDEGAAVLGHELFHARYHDALADVPVVWEEGLADRFGLPHDALGDGVRAARLLAACGEPPPELELAFALADGSYAGSRRIVPAAAASSAALDPGRAVSLARAELARLGAADRRRFYGIGFALVERELAGADPDDVPLDPPGLAPESAGELARWAGASLDAERRWRWALWAAVPAVVAVLEGAPRGFASPQECLASLRFDLRIGDGEARGLNDDPGFRESLDLLWPLIRPPRRGASPRRPRGRRSAPPAKLNGVLPTGGKVLQFALTPDSARVVYRSDQDANGRFELYGAPIDGSAPAVRLNGTLVANGDVTRPS